MARRKASIPKQPEGPKTSFPCCPKCDSLDIKKGPPSKCNYCGWDFTFPGFLNGKGERIGSKPTPIHTEAP